jgi:hypothetical protein
MPFGIVFSVLVCCNKKNLATPNPAQKDSFRGTKRLQKMASTNFPESTCEQKRIHHFFLDKDQMALR